MSMPKRMRPATIMTLGSSVLMMPTGVVRSWLKPGGSKLSAMSEKLGIWAEVETGNKKRETRIRRKKIMMGCNLSFI